MHVWVISQLATFVFVIINLAAIIGLTNSKYHWIIIIHMQNQVGLDLIILIHKPFLSRSFSCN